jgi:hypothetical protein
MLEGRRPIGRRRCRWEDKMDLGEIGWGDMNWINLVWDNSWVVERLAAFLAEISTTDLVNVTCA